VLGYETSRKTVVITTGVVIVISIIAIGITIWYYNSGGNITVEKKDEEENVVNIYNNVQENKIELQLTNEMIESKMKEIEATNMVFEFIKYIENDINIEYREFLNSPDYDQTKFNNVLKDVYKEQFRDKMSFDNEDGNNVKHIYEIAIMKYSFQEHRNK
jgi:hypothetical protein